MTILLKLSLLFLSFQNKSMNNPQEALEIKLRLHCLPVLPSGLTSGVEPTEPSLRPDLSQQEMLVILR